MITLFMQGPVRVVMGLEKSADNIKNKVLSKMPAAQGAKLIMENKPTSNEPEGFFRGTIYGIDETGKEVKCGNIKVKNSQLPEDVNPKVPVIITMGSLPKTKKEKEKNAYLLQGIHAEHVQDLKKGARFSRGDLENLAQNSWGLRLGRVGTSYKYFDIKRVLFLKSLGFKNEVLKLQLEIYFYFDKSRITASQATELLLTKCKINKNFGSLEGLDLVAKNPVILKTNIGISAGASTYNTAIISLDVSVR